MTKEMEVAICFTSGEAQVDLPKGAKNINLIAKNDILYFGATVDSNEKESERYVIVSGDEEKKNPESEGYKFLKRIYHLSIGDLYFYYKKC